MGQLSKVLVAFDNIYTVPQRSLDCGPGLGGLNQVMGPISPLPLLRVSVLSISIRIQVLAVRVTQEG